MRPVRNYVISIIRDGWCIPPSRFLELTMPIGGRDGWDMMETEQVGNPNTSSAEDTRQRKLVISRKYLNDDH